jgi:hypothetical protein
MSRDYLVEVRHVYVTPVTIEAEDAAEAEILVSQGQGVPEEPIHGETTYKAVRCFDRS